MKKLNSGGFVLAETLVVTVFIMTIFTILYNNFFPLIGEYEKREHYDDVDSKYKVYWLKNFIQHPGYNFTSSRTKIKNNGFDEFSTGTTSDNAGFCDKFGAGTDQKAICVNFWKKAEINKVFITNYNITSFKASRGDEDGFTDYINYLPNYKNPSLNAARYRVIAEFKMKIESNDTSNTQEDYYFAYSTIEVIKQ